MTKFRTHRSKRLILPIIIAAILLGALSICVQGAKPPAVQTAAQSETEPLTIRHTIKSQHPEQDRIISVQLPASYYEQPDKRYGVLYILDGNQNLELTSSVVSELADSGQMPEMIIVGLHAGKTRRQDYLPAIPNSRWGGAAGRFLAHIETELLPFIDGQYRTSSDKLLSGHSWGALFTTYAMTEKPDLFEGYLAQSPLLNKRWTPFFLPRMEKMLAQNQKLESTYFMTIGNERKLERGFGELITVFEQTAPDTLRWQATRQAEANHMQTRQPGVRDGLAYVFSKH